MSKQIYGLYHNERLVFAGDAKTCAEKLGMKTGTFYGSYSKGRKKNGLEIDVIEREYAVYKGDECLVIGDVYECAEALSIKPEMIRWYTSNAHKERVSKRKREYSTGRRTVVLIEPEVGEWPKELSVI